MLTELGLTVFWKLLLMTKAISAAEAHGMRHNHHHTVKVASDTPGLSHLGE